MKRARFALYSLVVLLALSLTACDAMFTTNVFAGLTHKTPTTDEIKNQSASQLATYVQSEANLKTLASNPDLKKAALDNLSAAYTNSTVPAEKQSAAATAAVISIQTVESAASFSSSLLGAVSGAAASGDTNSLSSSNGLLKVLKGSLDSDSQASLSSGGSMPASFVSMISAFEEASKAYDALGSSVSSNGGKYDSSSGISDSDKNGIAVNAVIATIVSESTPTDSNTTKAQALWTALQNPDKAENSIKLSDMSDVKSSGVASLIKASSLGSLLGE